MTKSGLNKLVKKLLTDRAFAKSFRKDPQAWARKYRLSKPELAAVLEGDESHLVSLGLDPSLVEPKEPDRTWLPGIALRMGKAAAALIAAIALLAGGSAVAMARSRALVRRTRRNKGTYLVHPVGVRAMRRRSRRLTGRTYVLLTRSRISDFARNRRSMGSMFGACEDPVLIWDRLRLIDDDIGLFRPPGDLPPFPFNPPVPYGSGDPLPPR